MDKYQYYSGIKCNPSLKLPDPISNATLFTVLLFIRHGIRSPSHSWHYTGNEGQWNCNGIKDKTKFPNVYVNEDKYNYYQYDHNKKYLFPPSCERSSLTDDGTKQIYNLGKLYYKYALMNNITSSTNLSSSLSIFSIRSSYVIRCIESALSFLNGFFKQFEGSFNQTLQIKTGKNNDEPLAPSPFRSKVIYSHLVNYLMKDEYRKRFNKSEEIIKKFKKYLNVTYQDYEFESLAFGDYINTLRCSNQENKIIRSIDHQTPTEEKLITPEIHKELMENVYFLEGDFYNFSRKASIGPIFKLILEKLRNIKSKKTEHIFNLFSGHSETLSALLTGFGVKNDFTPPFGSHFLIEVWKPIDSKPFLRVLINGEIIKTIPLKEFKKYAKDLVNNDDQTIALTDQSTICRVDDKNASNQDHLLSEILNEKKTFKCL